MAERGGAPAGGAADRELELRLLAATVDELEAALAHTVAVHRAHRQFLADAAHQLRTPLAAVQACAEALLRGAAGQEELSDSLLQEASRLTRLEADLRTLSRLGAGTVLRPAEIDLVALCREEINRLWSLAPQLDVVLRAPALSWNVVADDSAVREIVANLLDNARRHAHARIDVAIQPGRACVDVRVADDGPGVPEGMQDRIFERFVSLDGEGGSGLGLPIGRDLAHVLGGKLVHRDGAFVLCLPVSVENI
ncbi:MAG: HAMP domain-containing sensor histidine kinase [Mycobacteriales bacterium]